MKILQKIALIATFFCSITLPQSSALTPENTVIALDIDKVVLNLPISQWPVIAFKGVGLIQNRQDMVDLPKTLGNMYKGFTKKTNGVKGIRDAQGNLVDGLTAQMITLGMQHPESTRFIAPLLDIIEESRKPDKNIINTIKNTNLPVVFATNKDSITYQQTVKRHGLDTVATKAIVTKHPLSPEVLVFAEHTSTPENYRTLVKKYHNDKETDAIFHAPDKKPAIEYFQRLEKVIGTEKNIIFIDNKKKNIKGFNKLQSSDTAQRIGIHFKNKEQLKKELVNLGILS